MTPANASAGVSRTVSTGVLACSSRASRKMHASGAGSSLGLFERGPARGVTPSQLVQIEILGRFGSDPEPMRIRNRLDDLGRNVEHQRVVCPHAAPATVQAVCHGGLPRLGPAAERDDAVLHDHGAGMNDLLAVGVQRHREHSALIRVLDDGARDRRRSGLGNHDCLLAARSEAEARDPRHVHPPLGAFGIAVRPDRSVEVALRAHGRVAVVPRSAARSSRPLTRSSISTASPDACSTAEQSDGHPLQGVKRNYESIERSRLSPVPAACGCRRSPPWIADFPCPPAFLMMSPTSPAYVSFIGSHTFLSLAIPSPRCGPTLERLSATLPPSPAPANGPLRPSARGARNPQAVRRFSRSASHAVDARRGRHATATAAPTSRPCGPRGEAGARSLGPTSGAQPCRQLRRPASE